MLIVTHVIIRELIACGHFLPREKMAPACTSEKKASRQRQCDVLGNVLLQNLDPEIHRPLSWQQHILKAVAPFHTKVFSCPPISSDLHSNQESLECVGHTLADLWKPPSHLTAPTGCAANVLVPDTPAYLWRSCGVLASTGQSCLGATKIPFA